MPNSRVEHHWGHARTLFVDDQVEIVTGHGKAGGASSLHLHRHKANTFFVRRGRLRILVGDTELILAPGDSFTVRAGIRHRMSFPTDAEIVEVYVALPGQTIDPADIVRFDEGRGP